MSAGRLLIALRRWREARAAIKRRPSPEGSRAYSAACDELDRCAERVLRLDDAVSHAETAAVVEDVRKRIGAEVGL